MKVKIINGNYLSNKEKNQIYNHMSDCFDQPFINNYNSYIYFLLKDNNNEILSSATFTNIDMSVTNVCTPSNKRNKGYFKKINKEIIKYILNNNYYKNSKLWTYKNEKGKIPLIIYQKLGWNINSLKKHNEYIYLFYFPQSGIIYTNNYINLINTDYNNINNLLENNSNKNKIHLLNILTNKIYNKNFIINNKIDNNIDLNLVINQLENENKYISNHFYMFKKQNIDYLKIHIILQNYWNYSSYNFFIIFFMDNNTLIINKNQDKVQIYNNGNIYLNEKYFLNDYFKKNGLLKFYSDIKNINNRSINKLIKNSLII